MTLHLLEELRLPDRYERLVERLGLEVATLLTTPSPSNVSALKTLAADVLARDEGILVPLVGETGVGKTTFVMNADQWVPGSFGPSLQYLGELTHDALTKAVQDFSKKLPADNKRIIPINIDHRENSPPSDAELSAIKRFLRTNAAGVPSLIFWPETSSAIATELATRYVNIAGDVSIPLPLVCEGPSPDTWQDIARHTLALANHITNLELLGVDPRDYCPQSYRTLGKFLRKLSQDFTNHIQTLKSELDKKVSVLIVFASDSADPGVLAQLTSSARYGLLDAHALISVTPDSEVGRWWSNKRGLLTKTIVQLDAHAVCLPPTASASCIRNFSGEIDFFDTVGYQRRGAARGIRDLSRSDMGKLVIGAVLSRFEARGTTGDEGFAAFQLLAERGFNLGKDKNLNRIMKEAVVALLKNTDVPFEKSTSEEKLPFCSLIPDNAIYFENRILCIEYTWRKGKFLASSGRSNVAQYILNKLRDYARALEWTRD